MCLKLVKMVNFMLCVFWHNLKKFLNSVYGYVQRNATVNKDLGGGNQQVKFTAADVVVQGMYITPIKILFR